MLQALSIGASTRLVVISLLAAGFIPALAQSQQSSPAKAVRIVVPSSAGGGHPVFLKVAKAAGLIAK